MGTPLDFALLALSAVSTGVSIYKGQQAASQQRKAADLARRQSDLQAARQRRDAVRQTRMAAAQATQNAVNQGAERTSASLGGIGSIVSQGQGNISFLDQFNSFTDGINQRNSKAAKLAGQAQMFGDIANLAFAGAGQAAKSPGSVKPTGQPAKAPAYGPPQ